MRLFVALDLAPDVVAALADAVAALPARYPDVGWTEPTGWHLTLAFLGAVPDERADEVRATVADAVAGQGPIRLRLAEPGRFGRRVAWVGVADEPAGDVALLGGRVQEALTAAGLPVDAKPVHPHVTLARARGRRGVLPAHLVDDLPRVEATWTADEVIVYRSHLGDGPPRYEPLARVRLTAAGA